MTEIKTVLVTGSGGLVSGVLRPMLEEQYQLVGLDAVPVPALDSHVVDVADLESITPHFEGVDAVIHLAADPSEKATWDSVLHNNLVGTYNVFEAAVRHGVRKIVFASSNHVTGMYERDYPYSDIVSGSYDKLEPGEYPFITDRSPVRPDGYYGVSKEYGESLARFYHEDSGISVACIRIGTVNRNNNPLGSIRHFATLCSHRDLAQLVQLCLKNDMFGFEIFYGVSNNTWRFWDIDHAKMVLGYEPKDNAESFRKEFELLRQTEHSGNRIKE